MFDVGCPWLPKCLFSRAWFYFWAQMEHIKHAVVNFKKKNAVVSFTYLSINLHRGLGRVGTGLNSTTASKGLIYFLVVTHQRCDLDHPSSRKNTTVFCSMKELF
jgi:hypothetical protein